MRQRRFATVVISMLAIGAAPWMTACHPGTTEVTATRLLEGEEGSEPLTLSVRHRAPVAGERLPKVRVEPAAGALHIRVERAALCDTQARATIARSRTALRVVARVSANPAANCTPNINRVVEYTGVISGLAPGRYRVWLFEGVGIRRPELIAAPTVAVPRAEPRLSTLP
jgi:hypothetical protein